MSETDDSESRSQVWTADDLDRELNRASMRAWITNGVRPSVRFRGRDVERLLGRGAMGGVFLAKSPELDRHVALKLVARQSSNVQRVAREARALAQIDHPNVVKVHAVDLEGPTGVIEMEFVDGVDLGKWARTGPQIRSIVEAYAAAGDGLIAIHAAGLVHRDVKPNNVLRRDDGRIVVVDLGLVLEEHPSGGQTAAPELSEPHPRTRIAGTPGYMAPEVVQGERPTAAADQFGLACSLYESIAGTLPFPPDTTRDDFVSKVRAGPPKHGPAGTPRWLRRAIRRGLALEPSARFASMSAFVDELRKGLARAQKWWRRGGLGAVATVVTGLGWTVATQPSPCPLPTSLLTPAWSDQATAAAGERLIRQDHDAGPNALAVLTGALDRAQHRWAKETTMLCHAGRANEPTSQRRACLRHLNTSVNAHIQAVADHNLDPLGAAVAAAEELERLPSCVPVTLEIAAPRWSGVQEAWLRTRLGDAWTADLLGRFEDAHRTLDGVLRDTNGLSRVRARALYQRGHLFGSEDRTLAALSSLDEARALAFSTGNDRLLCEVLVYQAKVHAQLAAAPDDAARELDLATACLERTHDHSDLVWAEVLEARGLHALRSEQPQTALSLHTQALRYRQGTLGVHHVSSTKSLHNMGNALAALGDWDKARATLQRALELRTRVLGEEHPRVANIWFDLGDVQRQEGKLKDAESSLLSALEIYEQQSSNPEAIALTELALAQVALARDDRPTARQHLQRARSEQDSEASEPEALWAADLLHTEGVLLVADQDFETARRRFAQATELLRRHDGRAPAVYDSTLRELEMLFGLEHHGRLAARVRREEPWLSRHLATLEPSERGRFAWYIALAANQDTKTLSPIDYWRVALDAYLSIDEPLSVQELHWELARALAQDGRTHSEAIKHASAALTIEGGPPHRRKAIAAWLTANSIQKVEQ